jgi:hypothetical protein
VDTEKSPERHSFVTVTSLPGRCPAIIVQTAGEKKPREKYIFGGIMKIHIIRTIMIFAFAAGLSSFAHGQTTERYRVDIPFDFSVGTKQFQPGIYFLEVRGFESKFLVLRNTAGRSSAIMSAPALSSSDGKGARLDFWHSNGEHSLAAVRTTSLTAFLSDRGSRSALAKTDSDRTVTTLALSSRK